MHAYHLHKPHMAGTHHPVGVLWLPHSGAVQRGQARTGHEERAR